MAGFLAWTAEIKDVLKIPVIAVGRLEPEVADNAVASGQCDFVAMARKLLADPELPKKLIEDRPEDIRPCIYCYACVSQIFINERVKCAVNPMTGHEAEMRLLKAEQAGHVLVVGGGPAGMEAARTAALRGHKVTLVERSSRLGGTLFFAALAYAENGGLLDYLTTQMKKLHIDVRLNTVATPELIRTLGATAVVVATVGDRRHGGFQHDPVARNTLFELVAHHTGDSHRRRGTLSQDDDVVTLRKNRLVLDARDEGGVSAEEE